MGTDGVRIYLSDGGHSENLAAFSLARRECHSIIIVDAEEDDTYGFGGYHILKQALSNDLHLNLVVTNIENHEFVKTHEAVPVMAGTITSLTNSADVRYVAYIKLSIATTNLQQYSPEITKYYAYTKNPFHTFTALVATCLTFKPHDIFPQQSTGDQSYTSNQIVAYEALGHYMVTRYQTNLLSALNLDGATRAP
jgi:hypothetical protein